MRKNKDSKYVERYKSNLQKLTSGISVHFNSEHKTKGGQKLEVEIILIPFWDGPKFMIKQVTIDKTNHNKLKAVHINNERKIEKLEKSINDYRFSNQQLEKLAYTIAHDLKEPLKTMTHLTGCLKDICFDRLIDEEKVIIDLIQSSGNRMIGIVENTLTLAKMNHDGLQFKSVNLKQLINEILFDLEAILNESTAKISFNYTGMKDVLMNRFSVYQLIQNLIKNAIKFVPKKKKPIIRIDAVVNAEMVKVSVADNGIGIDPQYSEVIFGMYQRLNSYKDFQGAGLGLSICKRTVEIHKGKIWVESDGISGSTFFIEIPNY